MSVHVIYYKDGAKMMRPVLSREDYLALRGTEKQRMTMAAVRKGMAEQKRQLVQMNYSCLPNEDGTLRGATVMSTTIGMDVDHIPAGEMEKVKEHILNKKQELGLLMLEESARTSPASSSRRRKRNSSTWTTRCLRPPPAPPKEGSAYRSPKPECTIGSVPLCTRRPTPRRRSFLPSSRA